MEPSRHSDLGLLLLRSFLGGLMAFAHGLPKLARIVDGNWQFADPLGIGPEASLVLATFAELLCGALVVLGLGTRAALVPLIVTMLVAAFIAHAADPFAKKELAVLYLGGYLGLFLLGPGSLALSARYTHKLKSKAARFWLV